MVDLKDEIRKILVPTLNNDLGWGQATEKITALVKNSMSNDFHEALSLLLVAGPNPLLIDSESYWDRYNKLTDKYIPDEDNQNEG